MDATASPPQFHGVARSRNCPTLSDQSRRKKCPSLGETNKVGGPEKCPTLSEHPKTGSAQHKSTSGGCVGGCVLKGKEKEELVEIKSPLPPEEIKAKLEEVAGGQIRPDALEGVLLFLNHAARHRKMGEFEAGAALAEQYLSRFTLKDGTKTRLLPLLQLIGVITKTRKHSKDAHYSCRYRFALGPVRSYTVAIKSKAGLDRIQNYSARKQRALQKYPEREWIVQSLKASSLDETLLHALAKRRRKDGKPGAYKRAAEKIHKREFGLSSKHGRFHSVYSQIPDNYREQIRFNGEQATRLDLSGSHLHMLCKHVEQLIQNGSHAATKSDRQEELDRFKAEILSSEDAYAKILPNERNRKKAKRAFNTFLNKRENRFPHEVLEALRSRYPLLAKTIKNSRNPIGPILQGYERCVILEVVSELRKQGIFVIPVVDEILVPHSHRITAMDIFSKAARAVSGVAPKISGVRVRDKKDAKPANGCAATRAK